MPSVGHLKKSVLMYQFENKLPSRRPIFTSLLTAKKMKRYLNPRKKLLSKDYFCMNGMKFYRDEYYSLVSLSPLSSHTFFNTPFPLPNLWVISGVTAILNPEIPRGSVSVPITIFLPWVKRKKFGRYPGVRNCGEVHHVASVPVVGRPTGQPR